MAIVIAKTLIAQSGVFCRGGLFEHRLAQPSAPSVEPLGPSENDQKARNLRPRSNGDQTPRTCLEEGSLAMEVSVIGCNR